MAGAPYGMSRPRHRCTSTGSPAAWAAQGRAIEARRQQGRRGRRHMLDNRRLRSWRRPRLWG
eukprot:3909058-Pyramimonas_sp.AAC.1